MVQSVIVTCILPPRRAPALATTPPAELPLTVVLRIVTVRVPNSSAELEIPMESLSLTLLLTIVRLAVPEEKAWLPIPSPSCRLCRNY